MKDSLNVETIKAFLSDGLNDREIAEKMGCNRVSISRVRARHNLKKRDINLKKDKTYVCLGCARTVSIRRVESPSLFCEDCMQLNCYK